MNELVAQDVEAIKHKTQNPRSVSSLKRLSEGSRGGFESFLPIVESIDPVVVLPKRIEHIAVFHEHPYWTGKPLPKRLVNTPILVELVEPSEKIYERRTFSRCYRLKFLLVCISRVESNPKKYEARVIIVDAGFTTPDPTDRAMDA
ncbi:hypothetical protein XMV209_003108 [Aliiroseovarius sp. xm-v-209]|nr:hypothetical protein [Aliiroseovarius sp. xm-m-314]NRP81475.1 hypothetical protein [Aliiroseovarius sp. xm-v-209]NRQ11702.1 hypothetical protein [Aliiroseovarius sp. xm-v-208]